MEQSVNPMPHAPCSLRNFYLCSGVPVVKTRLLRLDGGEHGGDAEAHGMDLNVRESAAPDNPGELAGRIEGLDGVRQIGIGGRCFYEELRNERHDLEDIPRVERQKPFAVGPGE